MEDIDGNGGHGSCVGSKVAGPRFGIAKSANLVIVKSNNRYAQNLDGFVRIYHDIIQRGLKGKAVINFSAGFPLPIPSEVESAFKIIMGLFMEADVVFVTASGNDAAAQKWGLEPADIDEVPQIWSSDDWPIIIVGACDNGGVTAPFSKGGPLLTVLAPGVDIMCQGFNRQYKTIVADGSSYAVPGVAGLAAYLLSLYPDLQQVGYVARNVRDMIEQLAYPRVENGLPVVFNAAGEDCNFDSGSDSGTEKRGNLQKKLKIACGLKKGANATQTPTASHPKFTSSTFTTMTKTTAHPTNTTTTTARPTSTKKTTTTAASKPTHSPKPLYTLSRSVTNGQNTCFTTSDWPMTPGTYGFQFITTKDVMVKIGKDGSQTSYYQGLGGGSGSFYVDYSGSLSICATNSGNAAVGMTWQVFAMEDIGMLPLPPIGTKREYTSGPNPLEPGTNCFNIGFYFKPAPRTTYTFNYTVGQDTIVSLGDGPGATPNYLQAKGAQNPLKRGSMFLVASSEMSLCFHNQGSGTDSAMLDIYS